MSNSIVLGQACNVGLTLLPDLSKHECLLLLYKITKKKKNYMEEQKYLYMQKLFFCFLVQDLGTGPYHGHQTQVI